uniref:Uncharacterized protein n=1 Tax=Steinernema glaseri TaxID=37863 RepID=A0A1I8AU97_9BILA
MDNGGFILCQSVSKEQLERLVLKCEMSNKEVALHLSPAYETEITNVFDFYRHYSKVKIEDKPTGRTVTAVREGAKHTLRVWPLGNWFGWKWTKTQFP